MVELLPNWMQENCYPAQYDRLMLGNLVCGEGVADYHNGALLVTTGGAGLNLSVAQGGGWVEGDDDDRGFYSIYNDAAATVTATAADPTNPRIDTVVARVYDSTYGEGADEWVIEILAGTPTGGATLTNLNGAASVSGINALVLAYVLVPATFVGPFVNATHIRDARVGYEPCASMATGTLVKVYRTAAINIPAALAAFVYDTVAFGNSALYSTSTGAYTAPQTGFYRVSGNTTATNAGVIVARVAVAGVEKSNDISTIGAGGAATYTGVVYATAGQALTVRLSTGGGAANPAATLTEIGTNATFERIG